jgi:plasmid replication initiation protein
MSVLAIQERQDKYVKKHNAAIRSYSEMSLLGRKIANVLLYNAYPNLTTQSIHIISISQLLNLLSLKTHDYQKLKQSIKQLMSTIIEWNVGKKEKTAMGIEDNEKLFNSQENWKACTLLSSVQINGTLIKYEYSEVLRELFYQPSFYSKISLGIQSKFRSAYAISLYENCLSYLNCGTTGWLDIVAFRKIMGVHSSQYKIFRDLNRRVLQPAIKEVNKVSNIEVTCETKKIARAVSCIKLCISHKKFHLEKKISHQNSSDLFEILITYGASKTQATSWIIKHGEIYIKEKLDLIKNSTVAIKNPIAFLNKAIKENWSGLKIKPTVCEKKQIYEKQRLSQEENIAWFNSLDNDEKNKLLDKATFIFPMLKVHMEYQKIKILDESFINSNVFTMFMQILNENEISG